MNQGFNQMGAAIQQGFQGGMTNAMQGAMGTPGAGGVTKRNPLMTMLLPFGIIFGSVMIGSILAAAIDPSLALIAVVGELAGLAFAFMTFAKMIGELRTVSGEPIQWWPILIPIYNIIFIVSILPQTVARAKQARGIQTPARSVVVYFFFYLYALAADLNDFA